MRRYRRKLMPCRKMAKGLSLTVMQTRSQTTLATLQACKRARRKFAVLTCYDYTVARLMAEAGVDVILVGDTYGEVCLGHTTTLPVKLDHLLVDGLFANSIKADSSNMVLQAVAAFRLRWPDAVKDRKSVV